MKVLLIITLVIQPVTFAYSMMDMDGQTATMSVTHEGSAHEDVSDAAHDHASMLDNCCDTPACSPASITQAMLVQSVRYATSVVSLDTAMKSIEPASVIKPPQYHA